jgi:hypothetical protein
MEERLQCRDQRFLIAVNQVKDSAKLEKSQLLFNYQQEMNEKDSKILFLEQSHEKLLNDFEILKKNFFYMKQHNHHQQQQQQQQQQQSTPNLTSPSSERKRNED